MEATNPKGLELNVEDKPGQGRPKSWKIVMLIVALAFALRIFLLLYPEVIHNDGTLYISLAKQISSGDWTGGRVPPLYPSVIAFAQFFSGDYEMAGIWVSTIMGALLVLPVFFLGRSIFSEKVGILSALLAAVHPFLYMYSGSVLTESTYHFLLAMSVLLGWKAFSEGKSYHVLLFSLFTTLAYLTRPEGVGFLFSFCVWALLINPPKGKRGWGKRGGMLVVAILGFLLFSSPYLIQIRQETGRWSISTKAKISVGSFSEEEEVTALEEAKRKRGIELLPLIKDPLSLLARIGAGLFNSFYKFQQVFNPILFLFAVLGWIRVIKKESLLSLKGSFYILTYHLFFFGLVLAIFLPTRRYSSQMISISIPWAALGFSVFTEWIHPRWKFVVTRERFSTILLLILLLVLFIQGRILHPREHRFIQREAGLWMKDRLPRGTKVMSSLPQEAFYAELPWEKIPKGTYEEILAEARSKGVQYLIIDERIEQDSPGFLGKSKGEDLTPIKDFKRKKQNLVIFEILHPRETKQNG